MVARAGGATHTAKRGGFVMPALPPKKPTRIIPAVKDMVFGAPRPLPPPDEVKDLLGTHELLLGIDVETHQLTPRNSSRIGIGKYGLWSVDLGESCDHLRVVQIGWSKGTVGTDYPRTVARVIRPAGFVIDSAATALHRISMEMAETDGIALKQVLAEFFSEAVGVDNAGGRVVAHNLPFDAQLIENEMRRTGMLEEADAWAAIVKRGLCTMDPRTTHWVRNMAGLDGVPMMVRMGLKDLSAILLPNQLALRKQHHDAGSDAEMHWFVARELKRLANAPVD